MTVTTRLKARQRRFSELCRGLSIEENDARTSDLPFQIAERRQYREQLSAAIHALEKARLVLVGLELRLKSEGRL
jgi:hypothetical protein